MGVLNREAFLQAAGTLKSEDVDCPELGGTVRLRELSALEREEITIYILSTRNGNGDAEHDRSWMRRMNARLVAMSAVDENNQKMFPNITDELIEKLANASGAAMIRLGDKVQELSGMNVAPEKKKTEPVADLQPSPGPEPGDDGR